MHEYATRIRDLFSRVKRDTVLVCTNARRVMSADQAYAFRPSSDILYLSGCDEPERLLILHRNGQSELLRPSALHPGRLPDPSDCCISFCRDTFDDSDAIHAHLAAHVERAEDCTATVHAMRLVKSDSELAAIRAACAITAFAMRAVEEGRLEPSATERTVALAFELEVAKFGMGDCCAFPTIVAFDDNALELHHEPTHRRFGSRILVDAGASFRYYAADMSRSWQVGSGDERFLWVRDVVASAQAASIRACRPGNTQHDVDRAARGVLEARCAERGLVPTCPHAISHWIGLDTHDVGAYATPFAKNMTLAVEPGLYIADWGMGVRIEDTVRVDDEGGEVLTVAMDKASVRALCIAALAPASPRT